MDVLIDIMSTQYLTIEGELFIRLIYQMRQLSVFVSADLMLDDSFDRGGA